MLTPIPAMSLSPFGSLIELILKKDRRISTVLFLYAKSMPPILLQQGTADGIIPYQMAELMHKQVREICGEGRAQLDIFEGWIHSDPVSWKRTIWK